MEDPTVQSVSAFTAWQGGTDVVCKHLSPDRDAMQAGREKAISALLYSGGAKGYWPVADPHAAARAPDGRMLAHLCKIKEDKEYTVNLSIPFVCIMGKRLVFMA